MKTKLFIREILKDGSPTGYSLIKVELMLDDKRIISYSKLGSSKSFPLSSAEYLYTLENYELGETLIHENE